MWGGCHLTPPSSQPQIEETRQNIDKISENVEEAKKLYSVILSAPIPEQSECGGPMRVSPPPPQAPKQDWGGPPWALSLAAQGLLSPQRPKTSWSSSRPTSRRWPTACGTS